MAVRNYVWNFTGNGVRMGDSPFLVSEHAHLRGTDEEGGAPGVEARFEVRDGVPECVEFTLRSKPGGRAVRSADLRLFDLDGITLNTFTRRGAIRKKLDDGPGHAEPIADEREWWAANAAVAAAQRRRKSVSQWELEEVSRIYNENVDGHPTKAVEKAMNLSVRTAARRVQQAREAGLLPQTTPGKKKGSDR